LIKRVRSPFDINPDSLIYSDLHLHERKEFARADEITGLNSRLVEGLDILKQIVDILNSHPDIRYIYSLGDPFELKDKVPNHILLEFKRMLEEIERGDVFHTLLLGNHDYNLIKYPVPRLFEVHLVTTTDILVREGKKIGLIPFQRNFKTFLEELKKMNESEVDYLFFHQEIPGVEYESGRKVPGILPTTLFREGTKYFSGHIHKSQKIGKVLYVGSPYQIRFSDEGQTRYVWLLNSKTGDFAPLKLHYPEFLSFEISEWGRSDISNVPGNYVRIKGEVSQSLWDNRTRKEIYDRLIREGAKGVSFQIQVVKQRQTQIPENKIDDDESVIELYTDKNHENLGLDRQEMLRIGLELFRRK
jgi:hypothetical protein